ncbi:DUF6879 family protein [Dactylosporangium sp. CS-047395]|uniref:DUF6879 family protein n=1 Tax=Dactylosporangium sp. CS-047395 TaxID=3239936 RepID=UPI003D924CB1
MEHADHASGATEAIAAATRSPASLRSASYDDLNGLCRGISTSFVHLETRDAYGTEVELPRMAAWRQGEPDDESWLAWWLEMLRGHRAAGRTCRRARVVSEPFSDYQRWTYSHVDRLVDAGEDIRYVSRRRLIDVLLPGSGDFHVFDDRLALFLHYAGSGTNTAFEITEDPTTVRMCRDTFAEVWARSVPASAYRPQ